MRHFTLCLRHFTLCVKLSVLCLFTGALFVACAPDTLQAPILKFDLPASYKSDTAAYRFITEHTKELNDFGKKVAAMYHQGEKWKKKDFTSLSERQLIKLLKLDNDYVGLWIEQDLALHKMALAAHVAMLSASEQGAAKILEAQKLFVAYYQNLETLFTKDLQLDQEPYPITFKTDSVHVDPPAEQ